LFPLDIRDEEGADKVLDEYLGLVLLGFNLVYEFIECLSFELGFLESLNTRGLIDCVTENVLKVRIDRALMYTHELLIEHILSLPEDLFCLSSSRLLCFSFPSDVFCESDHARNSSLLLQPD
jgi:hypothetical protein